MNDDFDYIYQDEQDMISESERNLIYKIKMGLVDFRTLPEEMKTYEVCKAAMDRDPMCYQYMPDSIRDVMAPEELETYQAEFEQYKEEHQEEIEKESVERNQEGRDMF